MPNFLNLPHRKTVRLKHFDYTQESAYFITISTKQNQCIFGDIKNGKMYLNHLGALACHCWLEIPQHFDYIGLDEFVIMPNHVHGILWILSAPETLDKDRRFGNIVKGSISSIIRSYKASVTKRINEICNIKGVSLVWHGRFYEHIIRDEKALYNIRKYIQENPLKWEEDEYKPKKPEDYLILLDLPF